MAQSRVAGAARRLGEVFARGGSGAEDALSDAGRMIEETMNTMFDPAPRADAPPSPPPTDSEEITAGDTVPAAEASFVAPAAPRLRTAAGSATFSLGEADPSLLADFITESREYMEGAEAALLELEITPEDSEAVNAVFRAFHTIKGTAAFLGLDPISQLAHHAESLFSRFRNGELRCTGSRADLSLRSVDLLAALLRAVEEAAGRGDAYRLPDGYADLMRILEDPVAAGVLDASDDTEEPDIPRLGDILVTDHKVDRNTIEAIAARWTGLPLGVALVREQAVSVTDVAQALRKQRGARGGWDSCNASVRVRTGRLDQLINLVGELVIAQSVVAQDSGIRGDAHGELSRKVGHMGKIVDDIQELSVGLRTVPLKATFQRLARLVRDIAKKSGKLVEFVTEGEDTEIDRGMVDVIRDPLVHMIRNAVDHGIELPDVREGKGKDRTGTIRLSAYHAGGNVVVHLGDDGKGLDRAGILRKAVAQGLIETDSGMSDAEAFNLIFAPGFSTAEQVTDLSGRGVGMDVVKRNVESLHGRIDISSKPGRGSTFTILLPLTRAVTDGMLVRVAGERYILPTVNIQMSFRPSAGMLSRATGWGEMVLLRDELLPVVRLHRLFAVQGAVQDPTEALLVIVAVGDRRCALLVDELLGPYLVVVKSLGNDLGKVAGVSGGTILGDGRVGLILDVSEILALARDGGGPVLQAVGS